jgi:transcriptional regulator with XRE-family HTH domain
MLTILELKARRINDKLTQDDLAKKLGITRSYLSEIENGYKEITDELEKRYDQIYPKRLTNITFSRGVECPNCSETRLELLNDPEDTLDKIYRCINCNCYFTVGQAWGLHYRA